MEERSHTLLPDNTHTAGKRVSLGREKDYGRD